jgi:asparagine synthase (glutamine-hydrolysing)
MISALMHERFYVSGEWYDASAGVYVGWVSRDDQGNPVVSEGTDRTLIFSGEHYPDGSSKASSPEQVLRLYEEDPGFPRMLNGMFQGLIADRRNGSVSLFNDRYGMHRLYSHETSTSFYFAAEAKAILAVQPKTRTADVQGLAEYVSLGCTLRDRTVFEKVDIVPAAAWLSFRNGKVEKRATYFHPTEWESQEPLTAEGYYTELRETFTANLPQYVNSSGKGCAIALTGGLDTRVIMAWAKSKPSQLPCYTFGGMLGDSRDVRIARKVATLCHQPHEVIRVGQEYLSRFDHYAERCIYLSEGCLTVSNSPDLFISERARQIAPAKVVGTWGSEILRRAIIFKPGMHAQGVFHPDFREGFRKAAQRYSETLQELHPATFTAFHQNRWFQYGIEALEQTQLSIRAPFLANNLVRTAYRTPAGQDADVRRRLIYDGDPRLAAIASDRGVCQEGAWFGAVSRLYHEFTFKAEYAFDMGMPQWLAKLDRALPVGAGRLFLGRHKFLHFRSWYRNELSGYVKSVLLDSRTLSRPYLDRRQVERVVGEHLSGRGNHTGTIHTLLSLEHLQRLFVEG